MRTSVKILGKLVIITALFIVLSTSIADGLQQKAQTTATTQQPTVGVGQTVSASRVTSVSQQICGYTPKAGYKFVAFYCTVRDVANSGLMVSPYDWQVRDTAGGVYTPATPTFCSDINGFPTVDHLQPG
ncbi:MAG: hypothetical protein ACXV2D_05255, partial [Halobacteriota archaeon]